MAFSFAGEQREFVRGLAEATEAALGMGTVFFDEWFEYFIAGDDADLKLQKIYGSKCWLAIPCISARYGGKPWTQAEHRAIRARQMKAGESGNLAEKESILPLRVGDGDVEGILFNAIVPDIRMRELAEIVEMILARLQLVKPGFQVTAASTSASSWPESIPALVWPMADHSGVREAFGSLLTRDARWSYLPIRGTSEAGKSHITRQMLANVIPMSGIACGRFDFKGTTDVEVELRSFVQFLDVSLPEPKPQARLNERLDLVLDELKRRAKPVLLIFDTFEQAGEAQRWVDERLLPHLLRFAWLRVVIAGQCVPEAKSSAWHTKARGTLDLQAPAPEDWLVYGQSHREGVTLELVRWAHRSCSGKSSTMAQLLGPIG